MVDRSTPSPCWLALLAVLAVLVAAGFSLPGAVAGAVGGLAGLTIGERS